MPAPTMSTFASAGGCSMRSQPLTMQDIGSTMTHCATVSSAGTGTAQNAGMTQYCDHPPLRWIPMAVCSWQRIQWFVRPDRQ